MEAKQETKADGVEARANALKEEGNAALAAGRYAAAVLLYSQAIKLMPTAVFLANRAMAYIKLENYGLAIADADRAIELDPTYLKSYYRRGSANLALGKHKQALKDFRAVVARKPNDPDAKNKLKLCEKLVREAAFAAAIESEANAPVSETIDVNSIPVEDSYDGPVLNSEEDINMEFVRAMMDRFREQKTIHRKFVVMILLAVKKHLQSLPSLIRVSLPETDSPQFTVCGDTHGQFYDLLNIFELAGMPSEENPILFNGDFVDRGSFSFEVVTTLFALKAAQPKGLYMLRGNHETKGMNKMYGFEGEVKHKYDDTIMALFTEIFNLLPLAAVLQDKVFIVHGGISTEPGVTLAHIEAINRNRQPPEGGLMSDLLWSDPQPEPGRSPSKRGVGYSFGPDITAAFLERNGLELIIRSHEVKDEGYEIMHDGKCITVFSAPNYCDQMGNKGAFIRFGPDLKPQIQQFTAVPHPPIRPMAYAGAMGTFGL